MEKTWDDDVEFVPCKKQFEKIRVTVSRTEAAQPIVAMIIATIVPLRQRIATTMDVVGIISLIVARTIVNHAAIKAVTTGVIIVSMIFVETGRNSTTKIKVTAIFTNRVIIRTRVAA